MTFHNHRSDTQEHERISSFHLSETTAKLEGCKILKSQNQDKTQNLAAEKLKLQQETVTKPIRIPQHLQWLDIICTHRALADYFQQNFDEVGQ